MSRSLLALMTLLLPTLAAGAELSAEDALTQHRELTRSEPLCRNAIGDEIVVCGRREADRYRVPLIVRDPGDPASEGVAAERERLQHPTTPCDARGPFLIGCGMVGVSISSALDGSGIRYRELAK